MSATNFGTLGLFQKYGLIYFFLKSLYKEHCKIKWNSSSKEPHTLHFLSSIGMLCGLCHGPLSISNLCDDIRILDIACLNFSSDKWSKYILYEKLLNKEY